MSFHLFPQLVPLDETQARQHFPNGVGHCVFSSPAFQRLMAREMEPSWRQCLIRATTGDGTTLSVPVFAWVGRWRRVEITVRPLPFCVGPLEVPVVTEDVVQAVLHAVQTPFTTGFAWWLPPGFTWSRTTPLGRPWLGRQCLTFDDTYIITLDRPAAEYLKTRVSHMHRRHVQTSYNRGLEIIERPGPDLIEEYYQLYARIHAERQWMDTRLSAAFFHGIATDLEDGGRLILMRYRGQIVGGGVLLFDRQAVHYFQGVQDRNVKAVFPHAVLHALALEYAQTRGISQVNLGGVNAGNQGLLEFKRAWGAEPLPVPAIQWRYDGSPLVRKMVHAVWGPESR